MIYINFFSLITQYINYKPASTDMSYLAALR